MEDLESIGSHTALAPIDLGADIPAIVEILEAECEPEDLQDFADTQVLPCISHLRSIATDHLLGMYRKRNEIAASYRSPLDQAESLRTSLHTQIRGLRDTFAQLRRNATVLRATRASPVAIAQSAELIASYDSQLASLHRRIDSLSAEVAYLRDHYEYAMARVERVESYEAENRRDAELHLIGIRDFIAPYLGGV